MEPLATHLPDTLSLERRLYMIGTLIYSLGSFWSAFIMYGLFHKFNIFKKFIIQPGKEPKPELMKKAWKVVLTNTLLIQIPIILLSYDLFKWTGIIMGPEDIPGPGLFLLHFFGCMLTEDVLFYWIHRTLHHKKLFRKIHYLHHQFLIPRPISAIYAHPIEFIMGNIIPVTAGAMFISLMGSPVHIITVWIFVCVRLIETIDAHSGFDLPIWFPNTWPFIGSMAKHHDLHHSSNRGNFGSFFNFWDIIGKSTIKEKNK